MTPGVLTLDAPWALVGLLALPVLWWLHRRLARPPRVDVPSLLFFVEEPGPLVAAARRRRDFDLLLALVAATALALAAAGPVLAGATPGRSVRIVVAGGAAAGQVGFRERAEAEIAKIRAATTSGDRVGVVWGVAEGPRPSYSALASDARAGDPGLAIVISDLLPPEPPADVRWVAVGDPRVKNVGIVAADMQQEGEKARLLVTLLNQSRAPADVWLDVGQERVDVRLVPDEIRSLVRVTDVSSQPVRVTLADTDGALKEDDEVVLHPFAELHWGVGESLPAAQKEAALAALEAVLGVRVAVGYPGTFIDVDHWVLPADVGGSREDLLLGSVPGGAPGVHAPEGIDGGAAPTSEGLDLVYASEPKEPIAGTVTTWREAGGKRWPVVVETERGTFVVPDITHGSPRPASTPFWPLLVDAVVRRLDGEAGLGIARRKGLLDPASTRLGRVAKPFDPAWLAAVPPRKRASERPLRPWLVALGLAALAGLWFARVRPFAGDGARAPGVAVSRVG